MSNKKVEALMERVEAELRQDERCSRLLDYSIRLQMQNSLYFAAKHGHELKLGIDEFLAIARKVWDKPIPAKYGEQV